MPEEELPSAGAAAAATALPTFPIATGTFAFFILGSGTRALILGWKSPFFVTWSGSRGKATASWAAAVLPVHIGYDKRKYHAKTEA